MTIQQLYDWALENGVLNYDLRSDSEGYILREEYLEEGIDNEAKEVRI